MTGRRTKGGLGLALAATLCAATPAQAAMGCWNETQTAAAQVRNLQSRLMVAAMRCRAMGIDILASYNDFVRSNRETIQAANGVIMAQFTNGFGPEALLHYDRFTTSLANAYGADATDQNVCAESAALAEEAAAAAGDPQRLVDIERRMGPVPTLPGGTCQLSFASLGPAFE